MANTLRIINYAYNFAADILYFRNIWMHNINWDKFDFKRPDVSLEKRMNIADFAWTLEKPYARKFAKSASGNFLSIFVSPPKPKLTAYVLTKDLNILYFDPYLYKNSTPKIQDWALSDKEGADYIINILREDQNANRKKFESLENDEKLFISQIFAE